MLKHILGYSLVAIGAFAIGSKMTECIFLKVLDMKVDSGEIIIPDKEENKNGR